MKFINGLFLVLFTLFIFGCGEDPYNNYIGKYEYKSKLTGNQKVIEIIKNSDRYLFKEGENSSVLLEKIEGGFKVNNYSIGLSEDKNILLFAGREAKRITNYESEKLSQKISNELDLCKKLDEEAKNKSRNISNSSNEWSEYVKELQKRKPKNCILVNDGIGY